MSIAFVDEDKYNEWDIYYYPEKNKTIETLDNFTRVFRMTFGAKEWNVCNWTHREFPLGKKVYMAILFILVTPVSLIMLMVIAVKTIVSCSLNQRVAIDISTVKGEIAELEEVVSGALRIREFFHINAINEYFRDANQQKKTYSIPKEKITEGIKEIVLDTRKDLEKIKTDCAAHESNLIKSFVTELDEKISALEEEAAESANTVVNHCVDHLAKRLRNIG